MLLLSFFYRDCSNILSCIPTTNIFIEAGIENGGVLVHCFGGKSRSAAFVCAYMMSSLSISFDEAYSILKAIRPIVDINSGFEYQLRAYYIAKCDVYVAQQLLLRCRIRNIYKLRIEQTQAQQQGLEIETNKNQSNMMSAEVNTTAQNNTTVPGKGLFLDITTNNTSSTNSNSSNTNNNMMDIEYTEGNTNTTTSSTSSIKKGLPSLTLQTSTEKSQQYDSFYGLQDSPLKNTDTKATGLPKLTTQIEDPFEEYNFSKTRSISDVYEDSQDPCLDSPYPDPSHSQDPQASLLEIHEEDDEEAKTYKILQRKLHYIADSPSNANLVNPLSQPTSTTSVGLAHGFGALSTNTPNKGTMIQHSNSNLGNLTNLTLNTTSTSNNNSNTTTNTTSSTIGLGTKLSLGLNIGTSTTTSNENSPASSENKFHTGTTTTSSGSSMYTSSKPNFMQGSGHAAGNRTHRAGMQNNRNKAGNYSGFYCCLYGFYIVIIVLCVGFIDCYDVDIGFYCLFYK